MFWVQPSSVRDCSRLGDEAMAARVIVGTLELAARALVEDAFNEG